MLRNLICGELYAVRLVDRLVHILVMLCIYSIPLHLKEETPGYRPQALELL
jgi:hypothetical protein